MNKTTSDVPLHYFKDLSPSKQKFIMTYLKQYINTNPLYRQAAQSKVLYIGIPSKGVLDEFNYNGFYLLYQQQFEGYYSTNGLHADAVYVIQKTKKSTQFIDAYYQTLKSIFAEMNILFSKLEQIDFEQCSIEKINYVLLNLSDLNHKLWYHAFLPDKFDPGGATLLLDEIKQHKLGLTNEQCSTMIKSLELNFVEASDLALLTTALNLKKTKKQHDNSAIKKVIDEYLNKFYFVKNSWAKVQILTENDIAPLLKEMLVRSSEQLEQEIKKITAIPQLRKKEIALLENEYLIPPSLKNIFHLYRVLTLIRDERKEYVLKSNHFLELCAQRLAKEYNIDLSLLHYALPRELAKGNPDGKLLSELNLRKQGFLLTSINQDNNRYDLIISGKEAVQVIALLQKQIKQISSEVKGMSACKGKARGKVKIILGETHFTKFEKGDVLVAVMTRPEYVPLMKKAAGIVTDEGGLTCHAAVIARELNVPCIIGTQTATQKLMDGMQVEVDADNGIVRIIN